MSLSKKLLIKSGYRITVMNAPTGFSLPDEELLEDVEVVSKLEGSFDCILAFVLSQDELKGMVPRIVPVLKEDALLWIAYPKKSSKIKTDISRDQGWESFKEAGFEGVSLVSIDDTWSAFRLRHRQFIKSKK